MEKGVVPRSLPGLVEHPLVNRGALRSPLAHVGPSMLFALVGLVLSFRFDLVNGFVQHQWLELVRSLVPGPDQVDQTYGVRQLDHRVAPQDQIAVAAAGVAADAEAAEVAVFQVQLVQYVEVSSTRLAAG